MKQITYMSAQHKAYFISTITQWEVGNYTYSHNGGRDWGALSYLGEIYFLTQSSFPFGKVVAQVDLQKHNEYFRSGIKIGNAIRVFGPASSGFFRQLV